MYSWWKLLVHSRRAVRFLKIVIRRLVADFSLSFITGMGVGSLSMVVPLYNAELSPPEIRGSLVALQQLAITFGIMESTISVSHAF
jgi:MFS family permease